MVKPWYKRSKFWTAVATAALIVLNEGLGLGIDRDVYWTIIAPVIAYIFGESAVDVARAKKDAVDEKIGGTE